MALVLWFQIREGRLQGVGQCLVREYRMVCHVMQGKLSKDFFEVCFQLSQIFPFSTFYCFLTIFLRPNFLMQGCRAILLDKDKNPKV
jgi:3-hydroxyisobutyryl-CoA hydrolase